MEVEGNICAANSEESLTLLTKVNMIENIEVREGPDKISNLMSLSDQLPGKKKDLYQLSLNKLILLLSSCGSTAVALCNG